MILAPWQRENWRNLAARRRGGQLAHALLLCGPRGLGKRAFADNLAQALLCEQVDDDGMACAKCRACRLLAAGSHPDLVRVSLQLRDDGTPRKEIMVDQIRALGERVSKTAQFGGMQIALLDPADAMNVSAANALLKTLEEPTAATLLVLVADQPSRLPATIRSRCQRVDFRVPAQGQALDWLHEEGVEDMRAEQALNAAGGNPGLALQWLRDGGLELREEVIADLRALHAGAASVTAVADRWSRTEPEARLWFAAALAQAEAVARASGTGGPLALTGPVDLTKLGARFSSANRGRARLRDPLRPELVVLEALAPWQAQESASDRQRVGG